MTNPYEHHDLAAEFPEFKDRIHDLKVNDAHFAKLSDEYEQVAKEVARIEQEIETPSDHYTEAQKKHRALLKDQLFTLLQSAA